VGHAERRCRVKFETWFTTKLPIKPLWLLTVCHIYGRNPPLFLPGFELMTLLEDDLLAALKELLEASKVMTNGENTTSDDMIRYSRAVEWANRVITLAESETK